MSRLALLSLSLCFASCATARTNAPVAAEWSDSLTYVAPNAEAHTAAPAFAAEPAPVVPPVAPTPIASAPAPLQDEKLHSSRFTLKGGYYSYSEDAVDDGFIFNASWMSSHSALSSNDGALHPSIARLSSSEDGRSELRRTMSS